MKGALRLWLAEGGAELAAEFGLGYTKQPAWSAMKGVEGYVDLPLDNLGAPTSMMMKVIEKITVSSIFVIVSIKCSNIDFTIREKAFPEGGRYIREGLIAERATDYSSSVFFWGPNPFEILALVEQIHSKHEPTVAQATEGWQLVQMFQKSGEGQKPCNVQVVLCGFGPRPGSLDFEVVNPEVSDVQGVTINVYHIGAAGEHFVLTSRDAPDK